MNRDTLDFIGPHNRFLVLRHTTTFIQHKTKDFCIGNFLFFFFEPCLFYLDWIWMDWEMICFVFFFLIFCVCISAQHIIALLLLIPNPFLSFGSSMAILVWQSVLQITTFFCKRNLPNKCLKFLFIEMKVIYCLLKEVPIFFWFYFDAIFHKVLYFTRDILGCL